jgi:hypothetical protein
MLSDIYPPEVNIKKYKRIEDVIVEFLDVQEESHELPGLMEEVERKMQQRISSKSEFDHYDIDEAQDLFKLSTQHQKLLDTQRELDMRFTELRQLLVAFLKCINGKLEYSRKEGEEKVRITYLFWVENNELHSNR